MVLETFARRSVDYESPAHGPVERSVQLSNMRLGKCRERLRRMPTKGRPGESGRILRLRLPRNEGIVLLGGMQVGNWPSPRYFGVVKYRHNAEVTKHQPSNLQRIFAFLNISWRLAPLILGSRYHFMRLSHRLGTWDELWRRMLPRTARPALLLNPKYPITLQEFRGLIGS